jgi:ribosome biogenesis protein SSF1/2
MYPYTFINLKESSKNNIKDFLSLVDIYGLSHMMMFTNTEKHSYLHFAKMPKGPTVTFVIDKYCLSSDIFSKTEKDQKPLTKSFGHIPLLIMNGFNSTKIGEEYEAPMKIVSMMFQSFFPPVNLGEVQMKKFKRVVLINLNLNNNNIPELEFRHYDIDMYKYSVKKTISNIINDLGKTKDLSNFNNISDYILKHTGYSSCSDNEEEGQCEIIDEKNKTNEKTQIKLKEIGPRLNLSIFKIQEGFFKGNVVFHSLIKKSKKEIYEILTDKKNKEKEKKERQKIQDKNVKEKEIKKQEKIQKQQEIEESKGIFRKTFKEEDDKDEDDDDKKKKKFLGKKKFRDEDNKDNQDNEERSKKNIKKKKKKNKLINPEKEVIMTKRSLKQFNKLKKYK